MWQWNLTLPLSLMRKAEDWISEWKGMNDEFIEEDTMFRLDIPSVEKTEEWMAERTLDVNSEPLEVLF
jgi:hypothetical protein